MATTNTPAKEAKRPRSRKKQDERKQQVLTKGVPSVVQSIAHAIVIKDDNLFFLAPRGGEIPPVKGHGFGLYYRDCRYLNRYELTVGNVHPEPLAATAQPGSRALFQLTMPDMRGLDGQSIHRETIGVRWERMVERRDPALLETITIQNLGRAPVELPLSLTFGSNFEDLFTVRGLMPKKRGTIYQPAWKDGCLFFAYRGADQISRTITIHFSPIPDQQNGVTAAFTMALQPGESWELGVSLTLAEFREPGHPEPCSPVERQLDAIKHALDRSSENWLSREAAVESNSLLLNQVVRRSLLDLHVLESSLKGGRFFAAGVPWFVTLFGRDSLITALQTLAYDPDIARDTLRLVAQYQGQHVDHWRDEQPGKILHELRVGELARLHEIPHTPYYGTIDATPLFLVLISRHAQWTGDLGLFKELRSHVECALEWIERYGDGDGDGYLEYDSTTQHGVINQGWKDSGDAIVTADGQLARPPISLVEVQGYVYMAKHAIADLYERVGEAEQAANLRRQADDLRTRFNRDFWLEDEGFFALALESGDRPCAVISSNPGQALWTGIVDPGKAGKVVDRLLASDMYNGWGIRTLSQKERRYNPIGYHLGTVWPHDNALIAAGCRRYGSDAAARQIFEGLMEAAMGFDHYRLPEVFAGFAREEYGVPVHYPVACHPQAWAAGSIPYLLETMLGLQPHAFDQRLDIVNPDLPALVTWLELRRLRVGQAVVDLRFERGAGGRLKHEVTGCQGPLTVSGG
ncbi:amylo-alpha-1,6-glucosidase [Nitrospira sp. Nam80]